jgi:hypothetical protein
MNVEYDYLKPYSQLLDAKVTFSLKLVMGHTQKASRALKTACP